MSGQGAPWLLYGIGALIALVLQFLKIPALAFALASCGTTQTVPLTGRTHRISVSDEQVLSLSNQEYTKYMASR